MLRIASFLCFALGVAHLSCLFFLEETFAFYGLCDIYDLLCCVWGFFPYFFTVVMVCVFCLFGLYCLAYDGRFRPLPLTKLGTWFICALFLFRALAGIFKLIITGVCTCAVLSSILIAGAIGVIMFLGITDKCRKRCE